MDPIQAGFCNESPKRYPSSNPSPATLPRLGHQKLSPTTTQFRPRIRFSALFPALHVLKDALPRRSGFSLQQTLQPKTQIKILVNNLHLTTDNVMHPNRDPFSRARIPYLECSPPRPVRASIIELARDWEYVGPPNTKPSLGGIDESRTQEMRDVYDEYLTWATQDATYPYHTLLLPKIKALTDVIFENQNSSNIHLAKEILDLIRHGHTSFDAAYITSQLFCLPHFKQYHQTTKNKNSYRKSPHIQLKSLGRRLAHICAISGHPESLFWNVQYFTSLYRHNITESYHLYRNELLTILQSMAGSYPDTRAWSTMISLELKPGGNQDKARQYCLAGLERPTRPREYERILIHAGSLLVDYNESFKTLTLAMELLMQGVDSTIFSFARRRRWVYKFESMGVLAGVLFGRSKWLGRDEARKFLEFRAEVLGLRRELRKMLEGMGVDVEEGQLFSAGTLDEMMFQLLDPEAVLEEEDLMKIRPAGRKDSNTERVVSKSEEKAVQDEDGTQHQSGLMSVGMWSQDLEHTVAYQPSERPIRHAMAI